MPTSPSFTAPAAEPPTFESLIRRSAVELDRLVDAGHGLAPEDLADYEYRGRNVGTPAHFEKRFRKFQKVFFRHTESGRVGGWNLRTEQNGDEEPWANAGPIRLAPLRPRAALERALEWLTGLRGPGAVMGFFEVYRPAPGSRIRCPDGGLVIDYGRGDNPPCDTSAALRDVVVAARPGDPRLLLGRAYIALGARLFRAPGVFVMERTCSLRDASPIRARAWFAV